MKSLKSWSSFVLISAVVLMAGSVVEAGDVSGRAKVLNLGAGIPVLHHAPRTTMPTSAADFDVTVDEAGPQLFAEDGWLPVEDGVWQRKVGDMVEEAFYGKNGLTVLRDEFASDLRDIVARGESPDSDLYKLFQARLVHVDQVLSSGDAAVAPQGVTCSLTASAGPYYPGSWSKGIASATGSTYLYAYAYAQAGGLSTSQTTSGTSTYKPAYAILHGSSSCYGYGYAYGCGVSVQANWSGCN